VGHIHPRFRTPWISTIMVGSVVAFVPAIVPIAQLGHLVSIGTLFAFVIVCAGIWMLRIRRPDLHRPFKTPAVPLVPVLGIVVSLYLMGSLPLETWERLLIWLLGGFLIYFSYGVFRSRVQRTIGVEVPGDNTRALLGYAGSLLVAASVFLPLFSVSGVDDPTFMRSAFWLGIVILLLGLNGLLITFNRQYPALYMIGGTAAVLALLGITLLRDRIVLGVHQANVDALVPASSLSWGWFVFIVGAVLLLVSAARKTAAARA
jgi:uncharacterized membrane protein YecN with MAPEG domain